MSNSNNAHEQVGKNGHSSAPQVHIAARGVCRFENEVEFKFGILKMAAPEGATSAG